MLAVTSHICHFLTVFMSQTRANILLLLAGLIWGLGFVAQSTAMDNIGPLTFTGVRFIIATIVVMPFAFIETKKANLSLPLKQYSMFVLIGCILVAGVLLQQYGMISTSVTNTGFLSGLYVIVVPILMVILFSQWPHPIVWLSGIICLTGIWMLSGGALSHLKHGDWLIIFSTVFWALQVILIGRFAYKSGRPITLACIQFATCGALGLVLAFIFETPNLSSIHLAGPEILFTGIFSSGVAFTLQAVGSRHTPASQAAIFLASEALFAAIFAAILLGERIPALGLAGCGLIFMSLLMVEVIPNLRQKKTQII